MKIIFESFFKKLFLIFFSILLSIVFIEILLRISGATPFKKNSLKQFDEPVTNEIDNKFGWIPREGVHNFKPWAKEGKETTLTINKDKSRFINNQNESLNKIVFIGGSFTQGWGVNDEETFSYLLQKKFVDFKIFNFGVGGYGGYQSLLTLERIFQEKENVKNVVYGFLPHHEVRNVAAGSWLWLLSHFSKRGLVKLPYSSIDETNLLIRNKSTQYIKLPLSEYSALIAKIEKKIMKLKSFKREKKQTQISLLIIEAMHNLSIKNNSKFTIVMFRKFGDEREKTYEHFFNQKNISNIKCYFPQGGKYIVPGDGHPNKLSHKIMSDCIFKELKLE